MIKERGVEHEEGVKSSNESETSSIRDFLGRDKGRASNWVDVSLALPKDFDTNDKYKHIRRFVQAYTDVQIRRKSGNLEDAKQKQREIEKWEGYLDFEDLNESLFAAIDVATNGVTNRVDKARDPIEPNFKKINVPVDLTPTDLE